MYLVSTSKFYAASSPFQGYHSIQGGVWGGGGGEGGERKGKKKNF